jgi:catechol 2,3-dioxygenase-like lactoylglutathione lyase family enzyme
MTLEEQFPSRGGNDSGFWEERFSPSSKLRKGGKIMAEEKVLEGKETEIFQVGVVVKDLDKSIEFLTALGLGPFTVREITHPRATVRGKTVFYQVRIALAQQGAVQLELIEYQKGTTIQKEFLDEKGEGIHHLLFNVKDLKKTIDKFSRKGIPVLQSDNFVGGGGLAYMGSDRVGGIIMEIVQRPPDYDPEKGVRYE